MRKRKPKNISHLEKVKAKRNQANDLTSPIKRYHPLPSLSLFLFLSFPSLFLYLTITQKKPEQNGKSATHQQQINGDTKKQVQFTNSPAQENNGNKRKDKKEKEHNKEKEHKKGRGQEKDEEEEGDAAHGNGNNDNKEDPQQKRKGEQATINKKQALSTTKKEAKIASPPKLKQEASEVSPKKKEKEMPSPTKKEKKELKGAADEESKEKKVTKSTKGSEPEGEENNKIMDSKSINKKGTASRGTPPPKRAKKEEKEAGAKDENTTLKNSIITNATPVKKRVGDTQVQTPVPAKKIKVDSILFKIFTFFSNFFEL